MTDTVDFGYYGLDGNPYVNRELDPRFEEDRPLLMKLAGLSPEREIKEHIARTTRSGNQSTAFLLSGRAGTGRTTMAHRIFHYYREKLTGNEEFHPVPFDDIDHDSSARVNKILKAIRNTVIRRHRDRREVLMAQIPDTDEGPLEDLDLQARADFLAEITQKVTPPMRLGLLIDGVQNDRFMDTLAVAFEYIPAVIVVTRDAYNTADTASADGLAARRKWQRWAQHLYLPPLGGPDVEQVAANRWHVAAGDDVACPFELDGVRSTFDQREQPIGRAIRWLGWLLEGRLKGYEGDERWPAADELRLPAKWIEDMVQLAEKAPRDWEGHRVHGR